MYFFHEKEISFLFITRWKPLSFFSSRKATATFGDLGGVATVALFWRMSGGGNLRANAQRHITHTWTCLSHGIFYLIKHITPIQTLISTTNKLNTENKPPCRVEHIHGEVNFPPPPFTMPNRNKSSESGPPQTPQMTGRLIWGRAGWFAYFTLLFTFTHCNL